MQRSTFIGMALCVALLGGSVAACEGLVPSTSTANTSNSTKQSISTSGRVVYREQNGGFFGILGDDGRRYEPKNLNLAYDVEGTRIAFTGARDTTALGAHAWGNPIELAQVESAK